MKYMSNTAIVFHLLMSDQIAPPLRQLLIFPYTDRKMLLVKKSMKNYLRVEICTQPGTGTTCCASTWLSLNIPEIKHRH